MPRHCGDSTGLDDGEERPSIEEAPDGTEGFTQVNILAASFGHHGGKFAITQRTYDGHETGDKPCGDEQCGRTGEARDIGRDDKDTGADHGPMTNVVALVRPSPLTHSWPDVFSLFSLLSAADDMDSWMREKSCESRVFSVLPQNAEKRLNSFLYGTNPGQPRLH